MPGRTEKPVGVAGLGLLGSAIARRLLVGGLELIGLDLDPGRCVELGIEPAGSPGELAQRVGAVVLCLPGSSEVEDVCGGLIEAGDSGLELVLDCTTGDPLRSEACLLYTSPSPRDKRQSRMPSSA